MTKTKTAVAANVTFEWRIEGDVLEGKMSAPTTGWVAIGFNTVRTLGGTRLIMGCVRDGQTTVEEHIADPPRHRPKTALGGKNGIVRASGVETKSATTIAFTLKLATGDRFDVPLVAGRTYFTTFAWSREDDLYHHSAERTALDLTL